MSEVVGPNDLAAATRVITDRIVAAPRELLVRTKAKALRRAGYTPGTRTLDL